MDTVTGVASFRLLVATNGGMGKVCRIVLSKRDASLYLVPYGDEYFWGEDVFPAGLEKKTFQHSNKVGETQKLKLSLHQSGQMHVKRLRDDGPVAGPVQKSPLFDWRGGHLATVTIGRIDLLPAGKPKARSTDLLLTPGDTGSSRRFSLYVNGQKPIFDYPCMGLLTITRMGLANPVYVGIAPLPQDNLGQEKEGGTITVISGWNQRSHEKLEEETILWVQAVTRPTS